MAKKPTKDDITIVEDRKGIGDGSGVEDRGGKDKSTEYDFGEAENRLQQPSMPPRARPREARTSSGLPIRSLYTPADLADFDYAEQLGFPGQYPFTRGIHPHMYRERPWTIRQYAGYATAAESNRRFRHLLSQGQTGLSVAFDLPTQLGYDSDHPLAQGEVGRVGVAIDSVEDLQALFEGIPLGRISTSMTINATAPILLAAYLVAARRQGVEPSLTAGTVQNDVLKEFVARGAYIFPPRPSLRLAVDLITYCAGHLPRWNPISISGYHMREAGATAAQELAFTLANAIAYVEAVLAAGLEVDRFAPRLSFFFAAHNNLFEEVAKFRAARRLWARIMRERFGAREPRSCALRFHTQTAGCTLTAQQPQNNIVRTTLQALGAVLAGTQSLHTNSMDEALALPSAEAATLALRTQQIIACETGVTDTADPLGGSYYVESLTNEIEGLAEGYLRRVDEMGGALRAIEQGLFQREIQESAYRYQREVEDGQQVVVGVNRYVESGGSQSLRLLQVDPRVASEQGERLEVLRQRRDRVRAAEAIAALREAARRQGSLMPAILACVEADCTVGEISDALRAVFGEHRESLTW